MMFFILGILAGVLSGLFGIGGGIVMVPMLIAFFGMDILDANATSLAAMLLPVGIFGVITYYRAGYVNLKESLLIALGLFAGSFVGGEVAVSIDEGLLAKLYAGILLYVALSYLDIFSVFKRKEIRESSFPAQPKAFWTYLLVGVAAGIFAGMFGKGGGIVIVPILIGFFHYDAKSAAATSLAALQLPVGLPSVLIYAHEGHLNVFSAALIAAGILVGVFFGTKLGVKLPSVSFKRIYALFLAVVAVYMVSKYL